MSSREGQFVNSEEKVIESKDERKQTEDDNDISYEPTSPVCDIPELKGNAYKGTYLRSRLMCQSMSDQERDAKISKLILLNTKLCSKIKTLERSVNDMKKANTDIIPLTRERDALETKVDTLEQEKAVGNRKTLEAENKITVFESTFDLLTDQLAKKNELIKKLKLELEDPSRNLVLDVAIKKEQAD